MKLALLILGGTGTVLIKPPKRSPQLTRRQKSPNSPVENMLLLPPTLVEGRGFFMPHQSGLAGVVLWERSYLG